MGIILHSEFWLKCKCLCHKIHPPHNKDNNYINMYSKYLLLFGTMGNPTNVTVFFYMKDYNQHKQWHEKGEISDKF
jgi:hypothetical protein